jgi:hypothetical protein
MRLKNRLCWAQSDERAAQRDQQGIFSSLPSRARVGLSGVVQNRDFPRPRAGGSVAITATCPPVTERGRRRRSEHAESACSAPIRFASWGRQGSASCAPRQALCRRRLGWVGFSAAFPLASRARVGLSGVVQNRDFPRPRAWGIGGNHSMWTWRARQLAILIYAHCFSARCSSVCCNALFLRSASRLAI